ncbi:hypothetical protein F2P45_28840 [Massilia sp. CCM 8733]|uniref:Uncharacterized protein n=1 Tax=Massilia mucilaginosa TaxID=2609282 RepID=A0ABX0P1S3_9BURK|nr:hypothetical protein [Massilia mucilaginosa]NHZ92983.1 hypothetical protein [Massilia mucilaginosa]
MKSIARNLKAWAALIAMTLASLSGAHAADRVDMGSFSIAPLPGWHTESDKGRRLFSIKTKLAQLPMLILETCKVGSGDSCPSKCDFAEIERSGIAADPPLALTPVQRQGAYLEYEASNQATTSEGTVYTSVRLLCAPAAFIYAAQLDTGSAQQARRDLEAVLSTIKWSK